MQRGSMAIDARYEGHRTIAIVALNAKYIVFNTYAGDPVNEFCQSTEHNIEKIWTYENVNHMAAEKVRAAVKMMNAGRAVDLEGLLR